MPSSYHGFISEVLNKVLTFGPTSVLDVGSGFGKWGVLFREYLDAFWGRCTRRQWAIRIDGIEVYEPYVMEQHRVYSNLYIGDALEVLPRLSPPSD